MDRDVKESSGRLLLVDSSCVESMDPRLLILVLEVLDITGLEALASIMLQAAMKEGK